MKALPQTPNKKIDRKALPAPDRAPTEREAAYVKPESDLEGTIAAIWQRVLNVDRVGMQDNFFDLGGNSLLTVQVFNQLREAVGRQMSMTDMFRFPTVSTLAKHLGRDDGDATAAKGADRGDRRREAMLRRRRRPMQPKTETRV
jgi:acyl carrier protein